MSKETTEGIVAAVAMGGAALFVGHKLFTKPDPTLVAVPSATQPPTQIIPIPSGSGFSYAGPQLSTSPFDNPITIPVTKPPAGTGDGGTGTGTGSTPPPGNPGPDDDGLAWGAAIGGDEFNYSGAPNSAMWGVYSGPDPNGGTRSPNNVSVNNGTCTFTGNGGIAYHGPGASRKTYRSKCKARMSGARGHPVLIWWPDNDAWPVGGEDDYMETDLNSNGVGAFIHHPNQNSGGEQSSGHWNGDHTQWHIYAFERSATQVTGWVDGVKFFSFTVAETNGGPPGNMHPTIQLDQETSSDARFEIDYLRIYAAP